MGVTEDNAILAGNDKYVHQQLPFHFILRRQLAVTINKALRASAFMRRCPFLHGIVRIVIVIQLSFVNSTLTGLMKWIELSSGFN